MSKQPQQSRRRFIKTVAVSATAAAAVGSRLGQTTEVLGENAVAAVDAAGAADGPLERELGDVSAAELRAPHNLAG
jgi:hypothetical protein